MHRLRVLLSLPLLAMMACSESPSGPPDGPVGSFKVTATTTGDGAKPTQLQLLVDDDEDAVIIGANGSHVFEDVTVGDLVARVIVPGHCTADHYAPRTVEILEGEVAELSWAIRCPLPTAAGMVLNTILPEHYLWKATPSGSQPVPLESSETEQGRAPVANPARTRIAYIGAQNNEQGRLFVMDADGSNAVQLPVTGVSSIDWSPDGSMFVITRSTGTGHGVAMHWADGVEHSVLRALPAGSGGAARWSPDGSRIAYREGAYIFVHSLLSGQRVNLEHILTAGNPAWSPDGAQLAFPDVAAGELWVVDADGSNEMWIADIPAIAEHLDWGDDDRLLFSVQVEHTGIGMLRTLPVTGGTPTVLTDIPAWAGFARWVQ